MCNNVGFQTPYVDIIFKLKHCWEIIVIPSKQYFCRIIDVFKDNRKSLLVSCLCGALLGLSAPGFNLWFLAWFMLAPLFVLILRQVSPLMAGMVTFCFGLFYHIVYYSWFAGLHPLAWMGLNDIQSVLLSGFVIVALAAYSSIFYVVFAVIAYYILKLQWGKTILIALVWVLITDIIASYGVFAFNWAMIQYSQYQVLPVIQIAAIIGGRGLEFVIIMANIALALLINQYKFKRENESLSDNLLKLYIVNLCVVIVVIITITIYGVLKTPETNTKNEINISVAQASFPVEYFRSPRLSKITQYREYKNLINQCTPGLIILPEGAIATDLKRDYNAPLFSALKTLAYQKQSSFIIGGFGHLPEGETNAVVAINKNLPPMEDVPVYHKRHLVPYGEYTPFRDIMPEPLEKFASISSTKDFQKGKTASILETDYGKAGVLICYETIFPGMAKELVRNGAGILVNTSNLGWFHNSIVDQQFIAMCVLRAIENDRYFIVAINNGTSVIISPQGKIIARTNKSQKDTINAKIEPKKNLTFYTQWNLP